MDILPAASLSNHTLAFIRKLDEARKLEKLTSSTIRQTLFPSEPNGSLVNALPLVPLVCYQQEWTKAPFHGLEQQHGNPSHPGYVLPRELHVAKEHRRKVLPLLAYWTIGCESLDSVESPMNTEGDLIKMIQMSNGRRLPIPLLLLLTVMRFNPRRLPTLMTSDNRYRTAYVCNQKHPRLARALFRYTCPLLSEGPLLAHQRRRRLPDCSLITLIVNELHHEERDIWEGTWTCKQPYKCSIAQKALMVHDNPTTKVGILHRVLRMASNSPVDACHYRQLAALLIPSSASLNVAMRPSLRDNTPRFPLEIVALDGNKKLFDLLSAAGAELPADTMHPNEITLRQLVRRSRTGTSRQRGLPYLRLNEFEIDWQSGDIIRQGQNSRIYKARRKNNSFDDQTYSVKIIPVVSDCTIAKVAQEIMMIDQQHYSMMNLLVALHANGDYVSIITPFAAAGTLEDYLPTLYTVKKFIFEDTTSRLTAVGRGKMYLCHIRRIVLGCIRRLIYNYKKGLLHRNVRLANLVLRGLPASEDFGVDMIDYGLATSTEEISIGGTDRNDPSFYYMNAPEVTNGKGYTWVSEMWSFGMIFLSLWTCTPPFTGSDPHQVDLIPS
jgi:hypothetical protein